jgi:hypothetical protein
MATMGPPGAFRRITVHYSTASDEANNDSFLEFVIGDVLEDQVAYMMLHINVCKLPFFPLVI